MTCSQALPEDDAFLEEIKKNMKIVIYVLITVIIFFCGIEYSQIFDSDIKVIVIIATLITCGAVLMMIFAIRMLCIMDNGNRNIEPYVDYGR